MRLSIRAVTALGLWLCVASVLAADPLERAVRAGDVTTVPTLIEQGMPVDARATLLGALQRPERKLP